MLKRYGGALKAMFVLCLALMMGQPALAQSQSPFAGGWTLKSEMSNLTFQSVKQQTIVESSSFATLEGGIDDAGNTNVEVLLDSVDTQIDLRNVRMRFLFFETFKFPAARITTRIDPAQVADLAQVRRKQIPISYNIELHGVTKQYESTVTATLLTDDLVSIASTAPISIPVSDFNLGDGLKKLEDAASVVIIPSATVTFDWVFERNAQTAQVRTADPAVPAKPASVALETEGNFDSDACKGRFEILSRAGNIYFTSGSSRLEAKSGPLLDSLAAIVLRCPGMLIEVGGHTDSIGTPDQNLRLSESRAASVVTYLLAQGLSPESMVAKGYGETQPIADNATKKGRWDNRRIEFKVLEN